MLPSDPLALSGLPQVRVVADEAALLARAAPLAAGRAPRRRCSDAIHDKVRLGTRTLLGSLASGVAYAVLRSADVLPGSVGRDDRHAARPRWASADLIELVPGRAGKLDVQRRTCCLAFTLPQPKVCAGCCIK